MPAWSGLAVGRALAQAGRETIVVEAGPHTGQGVSSRNSEVIHAGLYYAPGSLKARLCVRGKELLYDFCATHGVPHARCGKLVVATAVDQHTALQGLQQRASSNGVPVQWLDAAAAKALEPAVHCTAALLSPSTGIVDSHALMLALQGDLERAGGGVALLSCVRSAAFAAGRPAVVQVSTAEGGFEIEADLVVNAAGLHACALARRFGGLDAGHVPRERYAKGSYFTLARPAALLAPGLPGARGRLAGRSRHHRPRRPGPLRTRPGMAGRRHAARPSTTLSSRVGPRRSRMPSAAIGPACLRARCGPTTAACGPRSTARVKRRPTSASMVRPGTAWRDWSTCSGSSRRG